MTPRSNLLAWQRLLAAALSLGCIALATPASANVMISQIYGGGGNSGAPLTNDFVELHNSGATAVDVTGWSVQYASAAGTSWSGAQLTLLSGSIPAGGYYLVQLAAGATPSAAVLVASTAYFNTNSGPLRRMRPAPTCLP